MNGAKQRNSGQAAAASDILLHLLIVGLNGADGSVHKVKVIAHNQSTVCCVREGLKKGRW